VSQPVTDVNTKILHVCESFGGGLGEAIRSYVHKTPEFAHHLLYAMRAGAFVTEADLTGFEGVRRLPRGHLARVVAVRRAVRELSASVVHAHSSYAGAYVRLAVRAGSAHHVVYTVHSPCAHTPRPHPTGPPSAQVHTHHRPNPQVTAILHCQTHHGDKSQVLSCALRPLSCLGSTLMLR
jgi:hypothetical protein